MKAEELLERLAELEHEQWEAWTRAVSGEVAPERRRRWEQLYGSYARLSEEAKEQDRAWARRVLEVLREAGVPGAAS